MEHFLFGEGDEKVGIGRAIFPSIPAVICISHVLLGLFRFQSTKYNRVAQEMNNVL